MASVQAFSPLWTEALSFASERHSHQRRKDAEGSPFINHPIETLRLVVTTGRVTDPVVIVASPLHDILEDSPTKPQELEERFGLDVCRLVEEVTDPPAPSREERRRRQLAHVRTASHGARLIRLADKAANLTVLPHTWGPDRRRAYLSWMGEMLTALAGTNAALEAVMSTRLRRAWTTVHQAAPAAPPTRQRVDAPPAATSVVMGARPGPHNLPFDDQACLELVRLFRRMQMQHSVSEDLADSIIQLLKSRGLYVDRPPRLAGAPDGRPQTKRTPKPRRFSDPLYFEMAKPGVGSVVFAGDAKGPTREVTIDGAKPFLLTPVLALLLEILANAKGRAEDDFPLYLELAVIATRLEKATSTRSSEHAVTVAIGRLREQLLAAGRSPQLVQTDKLGVRLRLRPTDE